MLRSWNAAALFTLNRRSAHTINTLQIKKKKLNGFELSHNLFEYCSVFLIEDAYAFVSVLQTFFFVRVSVHFPVSFGSVTLRSCPTFPEVKYGGCVDFYRRPRELWLRGWNTKLAAVWPLQWRKPDGGLYKKNCSLNQKMSRFENSKTENIKISYSKEA